MADKNKDENRRNEDESSGQKGGQATDDQDTTTQGLEDEKDMGGYVE